MQKKENDLKEKDVSAQMSNERKERKNLQKELIEKLQNENLHLNEKLLRNAADLENFKKRITQEKTIERKFANKTLINDLLVPLEQLRKVVEFEVKDENLKNFLIGFKMINDQFYQILETDGLKEIKALNEQFDPKWHYATDKESDRTKPNGIVLEVIQTGYIYKEQLLRPAMVKINEWSEENGEDK
ncbi:MAG: nucleotide exchange factor GrpE [Bacilli bacterium]